MQIGRGDHPPGSIWSQIDEGHHTDNNLMGDTERNSSVVYWRSGFGSNLDKGENIDEIIQSLVNETAR